MLAKRSMLGVFKKHYEALLRTVEIVVIVVSQSLERVLTKIMPLESRHR